MIRTISLMKKGEIDKKDFLVEIPYRHPSDIQTSHIIIKVTIAGEVYDFLLDTGASNGISKELAKKLNLKSKFSVKGSDINGKKSKFHFVKIDTINIGGINFINTGATVDDYNLSPTIACLKLDGIIGANLMRQAIWEIDPVNKTIRIANALSSLNISSESNKISFFEGLYNRSPKIDLNLNGQVEQLVVVDLGSNGDIEVKKRTFDKLVQNNAITSSNFGYGSNGSGIFGEGPSDTTHLAEIPKISIGDITLNNQIVSFTKNGMKTIGLGFLNNYNMIFNWFDDEIILTKISEYNNKKLYHYGFVPTFKDSKLFVDFLYHNSSAEKAGLQNGDQIIEVDGKTFTNIEQEDWCKIYDKGIIEVNKPVSITVIRNGEKLVFEIEKTVVLE